VSERPRVLLTRRWTDEAQQRIAARFDVTLNEDDRPMDASALATAAREYDAICPTVTDSINAPMLETAGRRVKLIGNFGVGYNHIDVAAAKRLGIRVSNTPDVLTDTTADLAILLMLMATRRAGEGERELRGGRWTGWRPTHLMGLGLQDRTLGLIGYGRIAQATARRAHHGFGMRIVYNSRRRVAPGIEQECNATYIAGVDELLAGSDVVSLHCPGGAETLHLIDAQRLARMKPTAVLVNTARGTVVDEAALAQALAAGRISAAGLDVYEREPLVHPDLLPLENVVLLPHLGSATRETRTAMGMRVAENLEAFFDGRPLRDPVV
jgi:lactate dehydrogenase-like 2-hydroxyacid dehydrogenase